MFTTHMSSTSPSNLENFDQGNEAFILAKTVISALFTLVEFRSCGPVVPLPDAGFVFHELDQALVLLDSLDG